MPRVQTSSISARPGRQRHQVSPTETVPDLTAISCTVPRRGFRFPSSWLPESASSIIAFRPRLATFSGNHLPVMLACQRRGDRVPALAGQQPEPVRKRPPNSRSKLADIAAVADYHKGFAFHFHGIDAGGGRLLPLLPPAEWRFPPAAAHKRRRVVAVFEEF